MRHLALTLALTLAACAATSHRFSFDPAPASFLVEGANAGEVLARGLVSVVEGKKDGEERLLHVALRLESEASEGLRVTSAQLLSSELATFGAPDLEGVALAPGEVGTWDLRFRYPEGTDLDLGGTSGLNLRLGIETPSRRAEVEVGFVRTFPVPESSRARWTFGVGVHG